MRGWAALAMMVAPASVIGIAAVAGPARADGSQDVRTCAPPCAAGGICLNGTCVAPAQPAPAAPDPADPLAYPEHPYPSPAPPPDSASPSAHPPQLTTPRTPRSSGFQPVLYAGVHALSGDGMTATEPGLRLGALLGGRATDIVSANGEITVDVFNFDTSIAGSRSGSMLQMTFSPLFHAATASADIVLGPKLGAWALSTRGSAAGTSTSVEAEGWTLGANVGVFFPVGQGSTALGLLFSFADLHVSDACRTVTGAAQQCAGVMDGDFNILSLTFAAML